PRPSSVTPTISPVLNGEYIGSVIYHGILPALTIIIGSFAGCVLGMRNMTVTVLGEDYVTLAEAKGLPTRKIMLTYAARNSILPSITGFAIALGSVVGGSLLCEVY